MRVRLPKRKTWVGTFLFTMLALVLWIPVQRVFDVAAVQNAVQRDWEISFGYPLRTGADKPEWLPATVDDRAYDFLFEHFERKSPGEGGRSAQRENRNVIYWERFRVLFREPIREIHVYDFEAFRGDLGAALARFPHLRRVTVFTMEESPAESEWTLLCTRLRTLPELEEIEIGGYWLTDAAIAPLAGHPQLRSITIPYARLTVGSAPTFASMPRLSKLHFDEQVEEEDASLLHENQAAMSAALPAVRIDFPPAKKEAGE